MEDYKTRHEYTKRSAKEEKARNFNIIRCNIFIFYGFDKTLPSDDRCGRRRWIIAEWNGVERTPVHYNNNWRGFAPSLTHSLT